jgi:hypothetical protein
MPDLSPPPKTVLTVLKPVPRPLRPIVKPLIAVAAILAPLFGIVVGLNESLPIVGNWMSDYRISHAKGDILQPEADRPVPAIVDFHGTADRPKDSSLWLVIYATGLKKYFAYEIPNYHDSKTWELLQVEIGGPRDFKRSFTAELYLLDANKTKEYRKSVQRAWKPHKNEKIGDRGLLIQPDGKLLKTIRLTRQAS